MPTRLPQPRRAVVNVGTGATLTVALLLGSAVNPAAAEEFGPTYLSAELSNTITLPEADGFNDTAVLAVSSDGAITVQPSVLDLSGAHVGSSLPAVTLTDPEADGTFAGSLIVGSLGLSAGSYTVSVTEVAAQALTATAPLTVGSGQAVAVKLAAPSKVYPFKDGYLDTVKATVDAVDETGVSIPFAGTVQVESGAKSRTVAIASATGAPTAVSLSVAGFPLGAGTAVAEVRGNAGAEVVSPAKTITFASTLISSAKLSVSPATVYPAKDGYRDTGAITFNAATSTGETIPVTGTVKVYFGKKLVKSWTLKSSAAKTLTWNGLNGGKLVPGKYTVKVSVKGPEGATKTKTVYVNVSKKRLVTKTKSEVWNASTVVDDYVTNGDFAQGDCYAWSDGVVDCTGYDAVDSTLSLVAFGSVPIPKAVRTGFSPSVRVTANVDSLYGTAYWNYYYGDLDGKFGELEVGSSNLGWMSLKNKPTVLDIDFGLGEYSFIYVDYFKVEYRYKVLQ